MATPTSTPVRPSVRRVFLPLMVSGGAPDLVASISISPNKRIFAAGEPVTIFVTITNQGSALAEPFWVDLSINPSSPAERREPDLEHALRADHHAGMAWRVENGLAPGQSITLSSATSQPATRSAGLVCGRHQQSVCLAADSYSPSVAGGVVAEQQRGQQPRRAARQAWPARTRRRWACSGPPISHCARRRTLGSRYQ